MKKKNLLVLLIAILFPLVVTVFIGMYTYGSFGNWDKHQIKFKESIFNEEVETKTGIENYTKFASSHYLNLSSEMTVYSDYQEKTVLDAVNGAYTIDNKLTISPYALAEVNDEKEYISYMFFLSNINYNNVTPSKVYFISVQGSTEEDYEHLLEAIDQFNTYWVDGVDGATTTGAAAMSSVRSGDTPIYDIHAVLEDPDSEKVPYVYSITPTQNYPVEDENGHEDSTISFKNLTSCSFAFIETTSDKETTVLMSGTLNNIKRNADALAEVENVSLGYGSIAIDPLKTLQNAGYTRFVLPNLALSCGIALVLSGFLSFVFYVTWTYEETDQKKNFKKSKK
jgi:hypothetical protein